MSSSVNPSQASSAVQNSSRAPTSTQYFRIGNNKLVTCLTDHGPTDAPDTAPDQLPRYNWGITEDTINTSGASEMFVANGRKMEIRHWRDRFDWPSADGTCQVTVGAEGVSLMENGVKVSLCSYSYV